MNALRPALFSIATLLLVLCVSTTASAASYQHIDRLAIRLKAQSRVLASEVSRHYRHAAHFGHLMNDIRTIRRMAHHIHEVAHHSGNPVHLQNDLTAIDRSFHHFERLLQKIRHDAAHGAGHVHSRTRHVDSLAHAMEDTIHHLRSDIREMTEHRYRHNLPRHRVSRDGNHSRWVVRGPASHRRVTVRTKHFGVQIGF